MREHIGLFHGKRLDNGEWVEGKGKRDRGVSDGCDQTEI